MMSTLRKENLLESFIGIETKSVYRLNDECLTDFQP